MAWPSRAVNELASMRLNRQSDPDASQRLRLAPAAGLAVAMAAAGVAILTGCAQVPTMPEPASTGSATPIAVTGPRGPLSQRQTNAVIKRLVAQAPDAGALERHLSIEQLVAGTPLSAGNQVTILHDGPDTFAAIFAAIHAAKQYLYLEYYIFEEVQYNGEQLSELLLARAREGVHIVIMYDSVGSLSTPGAFFDRLTQAGIPVKAFNPLNPLTRHFAVNDRDHRKLLLADGRVAIIGGVNLSADYESGFLGGSDKPAKAAPAHEPWHDTDLQIGGPAVSDLKLLFEQHWQQQGGDSAALAGDGVSRLATTRHCYRRSAAPNRASTSPLPTLLPLTRRAARCCVPRGAACRCACCCPRTATRPRRWPCSARITAHCCVRAARSTSARMGSCTPRRWWPTGSGRSSGLRISIIAACCSMMRSTRW